jgi:hypothetical protein
MPHRRRVRLTKTVLACALLSGTPGCGSSVESTEPPGRSVESTEPRSLDAAFVNVDRAAHDKVHLRGLGVSGALVDLGLYDGWGYYEWSPDHRRLGMDVGYQLFIFSADGSKMSVSGHCFQWSPDGRHLSYVLNGQPVVGDENGNHAVNVPVDAAPGSFCFVDWARGGSKVMFQYGFATNDDGSHTTKVVIADESGGLVNRTNDVSELSHNAAWLAPDGNHLVVATDSGLVVSGADGSNPLLLTDAFFFSSVIGGPRTAPDSPGSTTGPRRPFTS